MNAVASGFTSRAFGHNSARCGFFNTNHTASAMNSGFFPPQQHPSPRKKRMRHVEEDLQRMDIGNLDEQRAFDSEVQLKRRRMTDDSSSQLIGQTSNPFFNGGNTTLGINQGSTDRQTPFISSPDSSPPSSPPSDIFDKILLGLVILSLITEIIHASPMVVVERTPWSKCTLYLNAPNLRFLHQSRPWPSQCFTSRDRSFRIRSFTQWTD